LRLNVSYRLLALVETGSMLSLLIMLKSNFTCRKDSIIYRKRRTTNAIPYLLGMFGHACDVIVLVLERRRSLSVEIGSIIDLANSITSVDTSLSYLSSLASDELSSSFLNSTQFIVSSSQLKLVKMTDVLDEPSSKKPKLSSPSDFDDDPLSELEKLEPLPSILETMSQAPSSVHMSANNGPGPSSVGSTGATSQPPSVSHGNYMGPASVIQSQAGAPAQTHNAQSQQNAPSQPSVLQELLLNPSSQNNQTLNSPRPPYTTQYQTRLVIKVPA
uniref:CCR4-NOT transcription complex subunit 3 n=1 Tax=Brugia timori TaxID=42155 RepID=A0A0R3Q6S3_9BILA